MNNEASSIQHFFVFCSLILTFFTFWYQLLDLLLGKGHSALLRRAELKTLVDLHGNEVFLIQFIIQKHTQTPLQGIFYCVKFNILLCFSFLISETIYRQEKVEN